MTRRVLVPVQVLKGETVSPGVAEVLADVPVVLLGYHVLPEQTPPGQGKLEFEEQAQNKLEDVVELFEEYDASLETRIVFTHDAEKTIDRVADEAHCDAYLLPNPTPQVEKVLVPVHPKVAVDRVVDYAVALLADQDASITVFATADDDETEAEREELVRAAIDRFRDHGVASERLDSRLELTDAPVRATATAATEFDLVVMGERAPSLRSVVFGEEVDQIAELSVGPVLVVRRPREPEPDEVVEAAEEAEAEREVMDAAEQEAVESVMEEDDADAEDEDTDEPRS
ncbi:universal stress protein [Haloarchaeobius amylolyticus]|uniref:universal stress protein n=1 Tax=Haloarchaeobius amylolyticus TaxID=1198296 RepID=UPI00226EAB55|nr:universal stress protein [Haloarchaeobius amylolyticus]